MADVLDLIAKRKLRETWRDAVETRAGRNGSCLLRFDELLRAGAPEGEAAYLALREFGLLSRIVRDDEPAASMPDPSD